MDLTDHKTLFTVSQPKLKRICQDLSTKTNHEDIQKSQTYQQFVRNMENEIRRLQETEHFYNNGETFPFSFAISISTNCLFSFQMMLIITMTVFRRKRSLSCQAMWPN